MPEYMKFVLNENFLKKNEKYRRYRLQKLYITKL